MKKNTNESNANSTKHNWFGLVKTETKITTLQRKNTNNTSGKSVDYKVDLKPKTNRQSAVNAVMSTYFSNRLQGFFNLLKSPFAMLLFIAISIIDFVRNSSNYYLILFSACLVIEWILIKIVEYKTVIELKKLGEGKPSQINKLGVYLTILTSLYAITALLIIVLEIRLIIGLLQTVPR